MDAIRPRVVFSTVVLLVVLVSCASGTGNDPNAIIGKPDLVIIDLIGGVTAIELGPKGFEGTATYSLTVQNTGNGLATVTVGSTEDWITPVDTSVTIPADGAGTVSFDITSHEAPIGPYAVNAMSQFLDDDEVLL